ncbi:uncharacterized protein LOC128168147 [Crassostrea angulata]|uniref:uncharacterized protein LOC128168147 n=1 Tax=Magallana angulata TaxID=2784310 RepID=UPI0022B12B46|nr:uncharacterized protein LOC128168147 [Crassostrea angulata]
MAVAEMSKVRSDNPKSDFWLTGDFNLPDIDWPTLSINSHLYPSKMSAEYTITPGDCGVQQLVNTPTRGDKILDLFFTNNPSLVQRCKVIPGVGDHEAVLIDSLIQPFRSKPVRKEIYSWDKAGMTLLRQEVSNFVQDFIARPFTSVNTHWELCRDTVLDIINKHVPHKSTRSRTTNPLIDTSSRRLTRRKHRAFQKAKATKNKRDQRRYLSVKSECQRTIRRAYQEYIDDIITPIFIVPHRTLRSSFIKSRKQEASGVAPLLINDLPEVVQSNVKLFADGCLVYRTICSTSDTVQLQQDLSALEK